jgi:hypothetical protein
MFYTKKIAIVLLVTVFSLGIFYPISTHAQMSMLKPILNTPSVFSPSGGGITPFQYSGIKPFGGKIIGMEVCQKPAAILLKIGSPMGGNFLLTDSSRIYLYGNTSKGVWMLGNASNNTVKCMGKKGLFSGAGLIRLAIIAVAVYFTAGAIAGAAAPAAAPASLGAGVGASGAGAAAGAVTAGTAGTAVGAGAVTAGSAGVGVGAAGVGAGATGVGAASAGGTVVGSSGVVTQGGSVVGLTSGAGGAVGLGNGGIVAIGEGGAGGVGAGGGGAAAGGGGAGGGGIAQSVGLGFLAKGIGALVDSLPFGKKLKNLGTGHIIQIAGTSL